MKIVMNRETVRHDKYLIPAQTVYLTVVDLA
jgi:hypothetical protein